MLRRLEHVAVVGVNIVEALFLSAGQVQRISGSDEHLTRYVEDGIAGLVNERGRHAKPVPDAVVLILLEFF